MDKLRVGFIGLGNRGLNGDLPAVLRMKDIEVVAVCDLIEERAQNGGKKVREKYGEDYVDD